MLDALVLIEAEFHAYCKCVLSYPLRAWEAEEDLLAHPDRIVATSPTLKRHLQPLPVSFAGCGLHVDTSPLLPGDPLHSQAVRLRCHHEGVGIPVQRK